MTLKFVAQNSGVGSSLIFDYMYTAALDGTVNQNEGNSMQRYRRFTGEGLVFGIEKGHIDEFLSARGFDHIVDADADALKQLYFDKTQRPVAPVYAIVHAQVSNLRERE